MATAAKPKIRRGRYSLSKYEFQVGGENDVLTIDFVGDKAQGFGVPAKSLLIMNHAGGNGQNLLYFRTSENGFGWDRVSTVLPDRTEDYQVIDNCVFAQVQVWASNPRLMVSVRATPGDWTMSELKQYIPNPAAGVERNVIDELAKMEM